MARSFSLFDQPGETNKVLGAFLRGESGKTRAAPVPGGYRMRSEPSTDEPGAFDLFSYRTRIARRHEGGAVSLSPARYSTTTTKWQNRLAGMMHELGYQSTGESRSISAVNPHGWINKPQELPFIHYDRTGESRAAREERERHEEMERQHALNVHTTTGMGQTEREHAKAKLNRSGGWINFMMRRHRQRQMLMTTPITPTQPEPEGPRHRIAEGAADLELVSAIEEEPNLERKKAMREDARKPFLFREHRYLPAMAHGPGHTKPSKISPETAPTIEPGAYERRTTGPHGLSGYRSHGLFNKRDNSPELKN